MQAPASEVLIHRWSVTNHSGRNTSSEGPCSSGRYVMAASLRDPFPGPQRLGYAELAVYTDGLAGCLGPGEEKQKSRRGTFHFETKQQLPGACVLCPLGEWGSGTRRDRTRHRRAPVISVKHYSSPRLQAKSEEEESRRILFPPAAGRSGKAIKC